MGKIFEFDLAPQIAGGVADLHVLHDVADEREVQSD
jgi:hypothetical protein